MRGAHQWRTTSTNRIDDLHAVRASAKSNILNLVGGDLQSLSPLTPLRRRGQSRYPRPTRQEARGRPAGQRRSAKHGRTTTCAPIVRSSDSPRCAGCESELTPRHRRGDPTLRIWDSRGKNRPSRNGCSDASTNDSRSVVLTALRSFGRSREMCRKSSSIICGSRKARLLSAIRRSCPSPLAILLILWRLQRRAARGSSGASQSNSQR